MKEILKGNKFDVCGKWFKQIDEVIEISSKVALTKCHEDDGFVCYVVFEKGKEWKSTISCNSLEDGKEEYRLTKNYLEK